MKRPSKELELEVMSYAFEGDNNHRAAMKIWKSNPWLLVSMYEAVVYPKNYRLPLVHPGGVYDEAKQLERDVESFMQLKFNYPEFERAPEGDYELDDGIIAIVNRFGRVTNPDEVYGKEDPFGE